MGCRLSGPCTSDGTMGVSAHDLRYIRNHESSRMLTSYEQPITVQIEGRRGRSLQYHRSSDSSTQTERAWDSVTSDRAFRDGRRCVYLPNTAREQDRRESPHHDPELLRNKIAQKQNCLLSCCNSNMEEPSSFQSQAEDEDYVLEKTLGYLPLHHELDSGLGWTDGSFHQGELSGVETEEGLEECHAHQGGRGARVRGGSPSSESFISSELSDSGFYSVSTAEFLRFQRLLEKRMRIYNSRLHHQGELQNLCMDAQKAHRELEAIPEALATQQDNECVEMDPYPRQMVRVTSMQLHKNERPCLNRHSSSSAAIFSTCSSPSGQQRALPLHGPTPVGLLRRSRTLHHRPVHVEQRRRASHPASPNYCVTLNRYTHALQQHLTGATESDVLYNANYRTHHVNQPVHHANHLTHANHLGNHANHFTQHANHIIHHANHPTYHASYPTHQANHLKQNAHLANYTALHANPAPSMHHATHITNQTDNHANKVTHSKQHANLPSHPHHVTLPAQHTHHAQTILTSHAPHPGHVHATLPIQHTHHHAKDTYAAHSTQHGHTPVTPPAQHTHHTHSLPAAHAAHPSHAHGTPAAHAAHPGHAHGTPAAHAAHPGHAHGTPAAHAAHPGHAHGTPAAHAAHTGHAHVTPSAHAAHTGHAHITPAAHAAHPGHTHGTPAAHSALPGHAYTMLPTQDHSHNRLTSQSHAHATLPAQHTHHTSRTRPKHAISQPSLSSSTDDHHFAPPPDSQAHASRGRSFTEPSTGGKDEAGSGARDRGRFHTLSHTPSQEGNDTWPKTTNRHGPYRTLEGHVTTTTSSAGKPLAGPPNLRAMRNQLLRERALRLADERGGGISTDDETNVEIRRAGRYWSRSERREHVLQKQRQKKEALQGGGAVSSTSAGGDSSGYSVLMELSQRKLSRLRNRKLLDDWTTVEELLTHGTRLGIHDENVQVPNSLLTVTTV